MDREVWTLLLLLLLKISPGCLIACFRDCCRLAAHWLTQTQDASVRASLVHLSHSVPPSHRPHAVADVLPALC